MNITARILLLAWAAGATIALAASPAEEYVRDLRAKHPSVRATAAGRLGHARRPSAVPALIQTLKDDDSSDVRREAAKALGVLRDARAVPALTQTLSDRDANVRFAAAHALGETNDPKSVPALLKALGDPSWPVRDQAAWALRGLLTPQLVAPLVAALRKPDADVAHLVWLLSHAEAKHTLGPLAELLGDPSPAIRLRALRVIRKLGGADAADALVKALGDADPRVRLAVVAALLETRSDRFLDPLTKLLDREKDPAVRDAAKKAVLLLSRHAALAAHWSFDDQDTRTAKDVTGRGTDGKIIGCTPVQGKVGAALRFGPGRYIELGKPAALSIAGVPFTVAAWVKTGAPNGVVVARGGAFCGYSLYVKDGLPRFGIHRVEDGPTYIAAGIEKLAAEWTHLAGVVRDDRIEVYVNGTLAGSAKTPGYIPGNCGQGMEIGFDVSNSPAEITDPFVGIIDEVKVFNAALSAADLAKQCRTGR